MDFPSTDEWISALAAGDRKLLSRTITLAESRNIRDREKIRPLLERVPVSGDCYRIAVSGIPGVGKSTFIEHLGQFLAKKEKIAVLTVDPSSPQSGGSILGDKTRMEKLAAMPDVYIRPSPSGGQSGGIAPATADVMGIFELAGFNWILLETVGVGQSEILARHLVDHFILLLLAGGGDELQGIKRGIMELADRFVFNKSDITPGRVMKKAERDLKMALHLLHSSEEDPKIHQVSSVDGKNMEGIMHSLCEDLQKEKENGKLKKRRTAQAEKRFEYLLEGQLLEFIFNDQRFRTTLLELREKVRKQEVQPAAAASRFISLFDQNL